MISALFVMKYGPYWGVDGIDPWDETRNAHLYHGPHKVIAHPPCERWGRYWSGGPSAKIKRKLGDDNGCFWSALYSVRTYGGILEHPEASKAWDAFGLIKPKYNGFWTEKDDYGGRSCCVAQGHYGHRAQKMTWLYGVNIDFKELKWGRSPNKVRLDLGFFHSKQERARAIKTGSCQRLSKNQRTMTPIGFRDLLISMVK